MLSIRVIRLSYFVLFALILTLPFNPISKIGWVNPILLIVATLISLYLATQAMKATG